MMVFNDTQHCRDCLWHECSVGAATGDNRPSHPGCIANPTGCGRQAGTDVDRDVFIVRSGQRSSAALQKSTACRYCGHKWVAC